MLTRNQVLPSKSNSIYNKIAYVRTKNFGTTTTIKQLTGQPPSYRTGGRSKCDDVIGPK